MSLHFASARTTTGSPVARALSRRPLDRPANDNVTQTSDRVLHAALRYFAVHGLGAARQAHKEAERAFFAGDRKTYDSWIEICRSLDRRLAMQSELATESMANKTLQKAP